jgi:hypothetical protein
MDEIDAVGSKRYLIYDKNSKDMILIQVVRRKFKEPCLNYLINLMVSIIELMSKLSWLLIK